MAPRKAKKREVVDPLLALLDGDTAPPTTDELLDLIGGNKFIEPKPAAPQQKRPTYREHLLDTEDSSGTAHVIMPTDLVDRYREYDRAPGGKDYRSEYPDVLAVIKEQGIRQPVWISTDGKTAMLVEGNNRLAAAKELGIEEIPVRLTYDKETRQSDVDLGAKPAPLDPDLKAWVEENRIREDYRGKTPYGSDAFPDRRTGGTGTPDRIGFKDTSVGLDAGFPIATEPSRKSRSYLNPVHRNDVLAKAGAISVPYRNAVKDIQHRVTEYVRAAYESNPSFLTNHEEIDRLTVLMAPALAAGQMQIGDLTNAHLAELFGLENPPSVDVSKYGRPGVSRETELSRPFWTAVKAAREGKSTEEALAAGMRRMEKMLATDFQMAKVIQSRDALKAGGVQQYSRVAGPKACWLCAIAATQVYYTEDLLPIHPGCGCDVAPIPKGGQKTLDRTLDSEFLLSESADQVKLMTEKVESGATPAELRDLVAVREHGEIGPQLTWAHQKFTGPNDLPVPMSKDVLAHEAYETVRKNGGITIDLAGNQPAEGYAYAPYKTTEFKVPEAEFTPKHIDDYVDKHFKELSRKGNHLGMWVQDGNVYLDVSKVGPPTAATFAKAQAADQLAVFDLGNFEEINLGIIDKSTGKYRSLGEAADLHSQYREQVARADQARSAAGLSEVPGSESGSAPRGLEWDGPPIAKPIIPDTTDVNEPDWDNDPALVHSDIDSIWGTDQFDEYKDVFRRGARTAQLEGYSGFDAELYDYIESHPGQYGDARADETIAEYGKEMVSGAVHSEPTEDVLYRGIRVETPQDFRVGDDVSMPLSSFSLDAAEAGSHATGEGGWQSQDVPEDGSGIVFELEPGAKTYHHLSYDEHVAFGTFEVLKVTQYEPGGTTYVSVRQTSMIEADIAADRAMGTAALQDKPIPEFTVVKREPKSVEWDGPPVAPPAKSKTIDHYWQAIDTFDNNKEHIRRGARDAELLGYPGWPLDQYGARAFTSKPTEDDLFHAGGEFVSRAARSKPTKHHMYRGIQVSPDQLAELRSATPGTMMSMPVSAFSADPLAAEGFAYGNPFGEGEWRPKGTPEGPLESVVFRLERGAKLADVQSKPSAILEHLGFGEFEVTNVEPDGSRLFDYRDPDGFYRDVKVTVVTIRQTSMIEPEVAAMRPGSKPGTAALQEKIPEFAIVQKPMPKFGTIDLKTGKPDTAAERITKVQPGKIPDYGNSAAAGMQLHARHPKLRVDLGGIGDPSLARSSAQALDDMLTKYPQSQLHSAIAKDRFKTPSRYAQTDLASGGKLTETVIEYNEDFYGSREKLEKSYAKTIDIGYHPTKNGYDAAYAITVHEFAHTIDAAGSYRASEQAADVLRKEFLRLNPQYKNVTGIVEQMTVRQKYDEWLTSQLSGYATTSGRSKYGHRLPGDLNPSEAVAEAFAHVELDPENATDAERALHKLAVDSSKLPPRELSGAGWQSGIDTPVKVVDPKEAKRVAAKEKRDAEEAAKAERASARAAKKAERERVAAEKAAARAAKAEAEAKRRGPPPGETRKLLPNGKPLPEKAERVAALQKREPELIAAQAARYDELTEEEKIAGRRWYADQCTMASNQALDGGQGYTPLQGVAVNVALSPQNKYDWNTKQAEIFLNAPRGEGFDAIRNIPKGVVANAMESNAERAVRLSSATTYEEVMAALREKSDSKKLSNYLPSAWVKGHPGDVPDRSMLFTVDTWAVRTMDHTQAEIRTALGLPPGTRLTERQESRGEALLNGEKYGMHWNWSSLKKKWEYVPNYRSVDMIADDYDVFQRAGVAAAAKAPLFAGTYESRFNEATGRYETVKTSDEPTPWLPEDYQAALWGQIVPAAPPGTKKKK